MSLSAYTPEEIRALHYLWRVGTCQSGRHLNDYLDIDQISVNVPVTIPDFGRYLPLYQMFDLLTGQGEFDDDAMDECGGSLRLTGMSTQRLREQMYSDKTYRLEEEGSQMCPDAVVNPGRGARTEQAFIPVCGLRDYCDQLGDEAGDDEEADNASERYDKTINRMLSVRELEDQSRPFKGQYPSSRQKPLTDAELNSRHNEALMTPKHLRKEVERDEGIRIILAPEVQQALANEGKPKPHRQTVQQILKKWGKKPVKPKARPKRYKPAPRGLPPKHAHAAVEKYPVIYRCYPGQSHPFGLQVVWHERLVSI